MNLSWEVIEGVAKHNGPLLGQNAESSTNNQLLLEYNEKYDLKLEEFSSIEAQVASIADDIAYSVHDLDDALRANLVTIEDLLNIPLIEKMFKDIRSRYSELPQSKLIHESLSGTIGTMISDVVSQTERNIEDHKIKSVEDVRSLNKMLVTFSPEVANATKQMKRFNMEKIYRSYKLSRTMNKAKRIIQELFQCFYENPRLLPTEWSKLACESQRSIVICDYISGMTDRFAIHEHRRIFDTSNDFFLMTDDHFMSIALRLAEKNLGNVASNPTVGCVIVKDGIIIGEGYTGVGGRPHAEVVALQSAEGLTHGATMYITLEPCCHFGVTGPCTAEIIKSGIKRVVIATIDPDSRVSGGGIKALKEAGIEVEQGIMQKEAEELNVGFFTTKEFHRPFIACKIATTLDGKIATFTGNSKWITSEDTRNWVHELRAKYDAIMVGSNTLINDNPLLTCRLPELGSRSPIRLIIDSQEKLQEEHNIAKTADKVITWVITNREIERKIKNINYLIVNSNHKPPVIPDVTPTHSPVILTPSPVIPVPRHWDPENFKQLHNENWIPASRAGMTSEPDIIDKVCLKDMASKLVSEIGITRLLVEGGGVLITELRKHSLIDRLIICRSGKILGNDAIPFIGNLGIQSINNCYQFKKVEIIEFSKDVVEMWDRLP